MRRLASSGIVLPTSAASPANARILKIKALLLCGPRRGTESVTTTSLFSLAGCSVVRPTVDEWRPEYR